MTGQPAEELLKPGQVAKLLGVHPATIKRWARTGKLPCVRTPGKHRRYRIADVELLYGVKEPEGQPPCSNPACRAKDARIEQLEDALALVEGREGRAVREAFEAMLEAVRRRRTRPDLEALDVLDDMRHVLNHTGADR